MKRDINSLIGYKIAATDGELGEVTDFYFDDKAWTIRYLIVDTGKFLSERKVLISPQVVEKNFREPGKFKLNITVEQIQNSPNIDADLPVSRQQREVLHKHHAWENFWEASFWGSGHADVEIAPEEVHPDEDFFAKYDIHLRSIEDVSGYGIHAADGEIGHVANFILDDETWQITQLVVDTRKWLSGHRVLVDVSHVLAVQWRNYEVYVDMKIDEIDHSVEYAGA